jgi:pyruvate dehydrogenase E1 component
VYDPFVLRGLDAFIYSVYSGARFVVAGTPSGVTLAPEGGAHQSTITASVGLELPNVTFIEPAYAAALDWLMCGALQSIAAANAAPPGTAVAGDGSYYFRLTTRSIDQGPFARARDRLGDAILRRQVLAGAYRLVDAAGTAGTAGTARAAGTDGAAGGGAPLVYLAGCGAVLPEVLLPTRGSPRMSSTSPLPTGSTGHGSAPCGRACAPPRRRPSREHCGRCFPTGHRS